MGNSRDSTVVQDSNKTMKNSKLICEANRWTDSCVMRFLLEGRSEQIMILPLCGSAK